MNPVFTILHTMSETRPTLLLDGSDNLFWPETGVSSSSQENQILHW